ncbi:MAG: hypothetical protein ACOH2A_07220 [Sphingobacteriaceae bacterium]
MMNNLSKFLAAAVITTATFFVNNVLAQERNSSNVLRFGIGLEAGMPTQDASNIAIGATARLQYDLSNNVSLIFTPGYYHFFAKDGYGSDLSMVPVKAGFKAFFAPNFYFIGEGGAGFEINHAKNTKLILTPGIGYANDKGLDLSLRYENFSGQSDNYGMVGLRVAYGFKL